MIARRHLTTATITTTTLTLTLFASSHASAGDLAFTETFDESNPVQNVGDWTWGNNFERIVPQQGNGGAWRYNFNLVTCCPLVRTRYSSPSVFTGNYRENGVTSVGIDIARILAGFANPGCHYNGLFVDTAAADGDLGDGNGHAALFSDRLGDATDELTASLARPAGQSESEDGSAAGVNPVVWLTLFSDSGTPNNPNDDWAAYRLVEAHTVTPAQGSGFNPNPVWESYDVEFPEAWLTSVSTPAGWTFIELGPSVPSGAMRWQNLITDVAAVGWYLRDPGLIHLIQDYRVGIDNPRISMTAAGNIDDCTGTGNPDLYDISTGLAADCNRNGTPDSCEIADGIGDDCNGNGVLDQCEAVDAAYALDSGYHNEAIGSGGGAPPGENLIWAVRFDAGAGDTIENVSVAFHGSGGLQPGAPASIFIWNDPNNDGNPNDAVLLTSLDTHVLTVNSFTTSDLVSFDTYEIEPTQVSGSFFVGAMALGSTFPSLADVTYPFAERSWTAGTVDGDPTAAFQSAAALPADCLSGTFMIRANGNDANNSGIPDACEGGIPGDLNGDGVVNVTDLLLLLGAWGPCADCGNCDADLTNDCNVNVADLLELLGNWG